MPNVLTTALRAPVNQLRRVSTAMTAPTSGSSSTRGWDEALAKGWTVASMNDDWKAMSPPAK